MFTPAWFGLGSPYISSASHERAPTRSDHASERAPRLVCVIRHRWRKLLQRGANSRVLGGSLLLAGLYLVGLPLVFTVFAHETSSGHHVGRRIALTSLWFLCALLVGIVGTAGDLADLRQRARDISRRGKRAGDRRELAALRSIAALLSPGATGLSPSFRFNAFIPDARGFLVPVLSQQPAPWQVWPPGCGVVGIAWAHEEAFVQASGPDTVAPELGLTPQQRTEYGHLTFVAARAIFDDYDRKVGVLGVSCSDGSDFAQHDGPERFRVLASDMGILIGDAHPVD